MNIVIVGYGPGGANAAVMARHFASDSKVTILTQETAQAHRKPGSSLALEFPGTADLDIGDWTHAALKERGIEVRAGTRVVSGDLSSKTLDIRDSKGKTSTITYEKLILATGGTPAIPNLPGTSLQGVYTIQDMADASRLGQVLSSVESVAIVGAGFSGLEAAERLHNLSKTVHMIVRSRFMRRLLEEPMSEELASRIPHGIQIHKGQSPTSVNGEGQVSGLSLGETEIPVEAVILMTGIKPNVDLARDLGIEIGTLGGVKVNERMETSVEDVYAVGDCVELQDPQTKAPALIPIGSAAARAGRQAGVAAAGSSRVYENIGLRFQYDNIFGTDIICVGLSSTTARSFGIETDVTYLEDSTEFAKVALVTDMDGILIGGQVLASRMGARVAYQIFERIKAGATLEAQPLLKPRHQRLKEQLESTLGPIQ